MGTPSTLLLLTTGKSYIKKGRAPKKIVEVLIIAILHPAGTRNASQGAEPKNFNVILQIFLL